LVFLKSNFYVGDNFISADHVPKKLDLRKTKLAPGTQTYVTELKKWTIVPL
jgi:hypothetical protein